MIDTQSKIDFLKRDQKLLQRLRSIAAQGE